MTFDIDPRASQQDTFRNDLAQLQSTGETIAAEVAAVSDTRGVADACNRTWMHVETCTLFLHSLVIEDNLTSDARAADPLEATRTYLAAAQAQVKGVMSDEYEPAVAQKRLTMALALADTTLGLLSGYLDDVADRQRAQQDSRGWRG